MEGPIRECPICGGKPLCPGKPGSFEGTFTPTLDSWFSLSRTLPVRLLACLTCGYVGHYLDAGALEKLLSTVPARDA